MIELSRGGRSISLRIAWFILIAVCLAVFAYALQRDIRLERSYTGDLRNRVVGARLIRDGRSPYFYKWKTGDPIRYYDPTNFDTLKASIITSSPFLHLVLSPMVELPESRIGALWLFLEYILLIGMTVFSLTLARTDRQRQAVLLLFLLFLLTNAWKKHISLGQTYICIPFFAMLFFFFLRKNKNIVYAVAAGAAASCLVLIRINAIFFFIPFLFLARNYTRSWLLAFFAPVFLFAAWTLTSAREYNLWKDYERLITEQIKVHQDLHPAIQYNEPDPHFEKWEGIDRKAARELEIKEPVKIYSENGNAFVLFQLVFHRKLPVAALSIMAIAIIAALTLLFYSRKRRILLIHQQSDAHQFDAIAFQRNDQPLARTAIFGFCLYMISDLFSPIYRHQYYTVQWIFPLLLAAAIYLPERKWPWILLLTGLLLNCIHFPFIKMENTIGEYLILASLLFISLVPRPKSPQESAPASTS